MWTSSPPDIHSTAPLTRSAAEQLTDVKVLYAAAIFPFVFFSAILCTRWIVYDASGNLVPSTWYGEIVAFLLGCLCLLVFRPRPCRQYDYVVAGCSLFMLLHSVVLYMAQPSLRSSLLNNSLRILSLFICATALCRVLTHFDAKTLLRSLRGVLIVYSTAIIIHSLLLNAAGEWGREIAVLQPHELQHIARDPAVFGFYRAYGLCSEPSTAAGTLFLLSVFLMLADRRGSVKVQWYAGIAAALTGATSLIIFVPVYFIILVVGKIRIKVSVIVFASVVVVIVAVLGRVAFEKFTERAGVVARGDDVSANIRIDPGVRTLVGTLIDSPFLGYGIGQSNRADQAGYDIIPYSFFLKTPAGTFAGLPFIEIVGDFGIPGVLIFALWLWFGAMQRRTTMNASVWALAVFVGCTVFLHRTVPLQLWMALGILLRRRDEYPVKLARLVRQFL